MADQLEPNNSKAANSVTNKFVPENVYFGGVFRFIMDLRCHTALRSLPIGISRKNGICSEAEVGDLGDVWIGDEDVLLQEWL